MEKTNKIIFGVEFRHYEIDSFYSFLDKSKIFDNVKDYKYRNQIAKLWQDDFRKHLEAIEEEGNPDYIVFNFYPYFIIKDKKSDKNYPVNEH